MPKYSIVSGWDPFGNKRFPVLKAASDEQLEKWSNDPNCKEDYMARNELMYRRRSQDEQAAHSKDLAARHGRLHLVRAERRKELEDYPFDPRTEVSADAKHIAGRIVTNLRVIFVLLLIVLGILWAILK